MARKRAEAADPAEKIQQLNNELRAANMPEILLVDPRDCIPQKKNARFMVPEQMEQLVANVKRDGHLESVPLVTRAAQEGKYAIISGHHRIEAAKRAELPKILVMVISVENKDQLTAKQLSHNAISGQDDPQMLVDLYESIKDLSEKLYSGIQDAQAKVSFVSVNFRPGAFAELVLIAMPEDIEFTDEVMEDIRGLKANSDSAVRVVPKADWDEFMKILVSFKRTENIKSTGSAFIEMARYAKKHIEEREAQKAAEE